MDLWGQLGQALERRRGFFEVKKVKGVHKDNAEDLRALQDQKIEWADVVGNLCADRYVGDIAALCRLPAEIR